MSKKAKLDKPIQPNTLPLSEQGQTAYKMLRDHVDLMKKQQWTITNYVALIYGAIFAATTKDVSRSVIPLFVVATTIACLYGSFLILLIQSDLSTIRKKIDRVDLTIFGYVEYDNLELVTYKHPFWRGFEFTIAMLGIIGFGAFVVIQHLSTIQYLG